MKKQCTKCGKIKVLEDYYKCSQMADGHFNKCKSCYKSDVRNNYVSNRDHYKAYEQERWKRPERRLKALEYQRKRRSKFPGKNRARNAVALALKHGRLIKEPCQVCGELKVEAHHEDYRRYLSVMWLCRKHHLERDGKVAF